MVKRDMTTRDAMTVQYLYSGRYMTILKVLANLKKYQATALRCHDHHNQFDQLSV